MMRKIRGKGNEKKKEKKFKGFEVEKYEKRKVEVCVLIKIGMCSGHAYVEIYYCLIPSIFFDYSLIHMVSNIRICISL